MHRLDGLKDASRSERPPVFTAARRAKVNRVGLCVASREQGAAAIELDVRLILTTDTDPRDSHLLTRIATTTSTQLARSEIITRWQTPIPMTVLYTHRILTDTTAIEWEICVNTEPYFETTSYWADLFTQDEIAAQRHSRTIALQCNMPRSDYESLKSRQGEGFRWRLSMAIAHLPTGLLPASLQALASDLDRYPAVQAMIGRAHAGQVPRPDLTPWAGLDQTPATPDWVALLPGAG